MGLIIPITWEICDDLASNVTLLLRTVTNENDFNVPSPSSTAVTRVDMKYLRDASSVSSLKGYWNSMLAQISLSDGPGRRSSNLSHSLAPKVFLAMLFICAEDDS